MSYWEPEPEPRNVVITRVDRNRGNPQYPGPMTAEQLRHYGVPETPDDLTTALRMIQQDIGRSRTVGQASSTTRPMNINPQTDNRFLSARDRTVRANMFAPGTPIGAQANAMDPDTAAEIDRIRRLAQLNIAEHEQAVQNANREAENRRIPVRRDIDIQNIYQQHMPGAVTGEYGELDQALARVVPLTQQAYDEGVQNILSDYGVGIAGQQGQMTSADALGAQLQALAGNQEGFQQGVEGFSDFMGNLLQNAATQSSQGLGREGAGIMGAIQGSLPGYGAERDQVIGDERLSSQAQVQNLLQQLALIQPEFIPFNYGELMTETDQRIADAMARGQDRAARARAEEEANNRRGYEGIEGMNMFALERGRPDLVQPVLDMLAESEMAGNPSGTLGLIRDYMPTTGMTPIPAPEWSEPQSKGWMDRITEGASRLQHFQNPFDVSGSTRSITNMDERNRAIAQREQEAAAARQLMETLYRISQGQYTNQLMM